MFSVSLAGLPICDLDSSSRATRLRFETRPVCFSRLRWWLCYLGLHSPCFGCDPSQTLHCPFFKAIWCSAAVSTRILHTIQVLPAHSFDLAYAVTTAVLTHILHMKCLLGVHRLVLASVFVHQSVSIAWSLQVFLSISLAFCPYMMSAQCLLSIPSSLS